VIHATTATVSPSLYDQQPAAASISEIVVCMIILVLDVDGTQADEDDQGQ
jgi:hypothetical protein